MQPTGREGSVSQDTATYDSPPQGDRNTTQKQFYRNVPRSLTAMLSSGCPIETVFAPGENRDREVPDAWN